MNADDRADLFRKAQNIIYKSYGPYSPFDGSVSHLDRMYAYEIAEENCFPPSSDKRMLCDLAKATDAAADDFIRNPDIWTKDVYARNKNGDEVNPESSAAVAWCALGRIRYHVSRYDNSDNIVNKVCERLYDQSVDGLNDMEDTDINKITTALRRVAVKLHAFCRSM
jgi:hypothetical protein